MTSDKKASVPGEPAPALSRAVKQLLRPLVALLMDHGFTYSWLVRNLKPIFLEVAQKDFQIDGKPQTDSRISLLTGLDRKEIRKLREDPATPLGAPESNSIGANLVTLWMSDPRFIDADNNPAPLPRLRKNAAGGETASFEELFELVTKSIKPRAFLDEWVRNGTVSINDKDEVCIELNHYVTSKSFEEKVFYLGKNIHEHLAAARMNVNSADPPFLERSVFYYDLSEDSVSDLSALSRDKGMEFLRQLNTTAHRLQIRDSRVGEKLKRMHVGVYFYSGENDHEY